MPFVTHGICPKCSQQVLPGGAAALPGTGLVVCIECFKSETGRFPLPSQTLSLPGGSKLASRSGVVIGPDSCWTPPGPSPVPVPYPNVGQAAAGATKSSAAPSPSTPRPAPLDIAVAKKSSASGVQFVTMPTKVILTA